METVRREMEALGAFKEIDGSYLGLEISPQRCRIKESNEKKMETRGI